MVEANILAAQAEAVTGATINIACGERFSLLDLLALIAEALGSAEPLPVRFEGARSGDVRDSLADIQRARRLLGYRVLVDTREGLRRTVEWYRKLAAAR